MTSVSRFWVLSEKNQGWFPLLICHLKFTRPKVDKSEGAGSTLRPDPCLGAQEGSMMMMMSRHENDDDGDDVDDDDDGGGCCYRNEGVLKVVVAMSADKG